MLYLPDRHPASATPACFTPSAPAATTLYPPTAPTGPLAGAATTTAAATAAGPVRTPQFRASIQGRAGAGQGGLRDSLRWSEGERPGMTVRRKWGQGFVIATYPNRLAFVHFQALVAIKHVAKAKVTEWAEVRDSCSWHLLHLLCPVHAGKIMNRTGSENVKETRYCFAKVEQPNWLPRKNCANGPRQTSDPSFLPLCTPRFFRSAASKKNQHRSAVCNASSLGRERQTRQSEAATTVEEHPK